MNEYKGNKGPTHEYEESIIENAHVMMVVLEDDGTVKKWNRAAEQITGYPADEVVGGRDIWKRLYPDPAYRREITGRINEILSEKNYFENLDATITTKDGSHRTISWNTREFDTGSGVLAIAVGRDITELTEARDRLVAMNNFQNAVIENANILIAALDDSGTIYLWNRAAEQITGYPADEVVGRRDIWKRLYPDPEYRGKITNRIKEILTDKDYFENFDTTIKTKDGSSRTISWNTREFDTSSGVRAIAVGRDTTELTEARDRLVAMNNFQNAVIENANILFAVLDDSGTIYLWNRAAEQITGYPADEVVGGRDIWKRLYPEQKYRKEVNRCIADMIREKKYFSNLETTIRTRDGSHRIISWNTREIPYLQGTRIISVGLDTTAKKEAEMALVAYITEAAMRLKNPVEIIGDNLADIRNLLGKNKIEVDDALALLDIQVRNAEQIVSNLQELQEGIAEKSEAIPDSYREFLLRR